MNEGTTQATTIQILDRDRKAWIETTLQSVRDIQRVLGDNMGGIQGRICNAAINSAYEQASHEITEIFGYKIETNPRSEKSNE